MATSTVSRLASVTARDGFDTRKKDLNVACNEKQELACEDCQEGVARHSFTGLSGKMIVLCDSCNDVATTAMCDRDHLMDIKMDKCQDCGIASATHEFMHFHNGIFHLCEECFYDADHEDDYGKEFTDVGEQEDDFYPEEDEVDDDDWSMDEGEDWGSDRKLPIIVPSSKRTSQDPIGIQKARDATAWYGARSRNNAVEFELVATVLHPSRVERSIEAYGYDIATDNSAW